MLNAKRLILVVSLGCTAVLYGSDKGDQKADNNAGSGAQRAALTEKAAVDSAAIAALWNYYKSGDLNRDGVHDQIRSLKSLRSKQIMVDGTAKGLEKLTKAVQENTQEQDELWQKVSSSHNFKVGKPFANLVAEQKDGAWTRYENLGIEGGPDLVDVYKVAKDGSAYAYAKVHVRTLGSRAGQLAERTVITVHSPTGWVKKHVDVNTWSTC